jgi:hypothetical protein
MMNYEMIRRRRFLGTSVCLAAESWWAKHVECVQLAAALNLKVSFWGERKAKRQQAARTPHEDTAKHTGAMKTGSFETTESRLIAFCL